jgi:tetratricopeptide (TPR) repeat protein
MSPYEAACEHLAKGMALLDAGSTECALKEIRAALAAEPEFSYAHLIHGAALKRLGRLHQALRAYDEAAMVEDATWHIERATCLSLMGRDREALRAADAALAIAPEDPIIWYRKGAALVRAARSNALRPDRHLEELGEAALRRALALDPQAYLARLDLAQLCLLKRPEEANRLLAEALAIRCGDPRIHLAAAEAALRAGRLDEAQSHIQVVIAATPGSSHAVELLVRIRNARASRVYNALQRLGWAALRRRRGIYAACALVGVAAFAAGVTRAQLSTAGAIVVAAWLIWLAINRLQVKRQLSRPALSPDF